MPLDKITMTIEESTKARVIQAGKKDGRSMSNMANKLLDEAAKLEAAGDHENAKKNREDAARLKLGVGRAEAADPQEQLLQGDRKHRLSLLRAGIAQLKMKMLEDDVTEDAKARYAQVIDEAETEIAELLGIPRPQPRRRRRSCCSTFCNNSE